MKSFTLVPATLLAVALVATSPVVSAADNARPQRGDMVKKMDKDGDGRLARTELPSSERAQQRFEAMDADKDGYVTQAEAQAARQNRRADRKAEMEQRFKDADINGDGQFSLDEVQAKMPRLAERFNELDADKNGYLTREEMRAGAKQRHQQRSKERPAS